MDEPYNDDSHDSLIELNLASVKKRAVSGVAILTGRGFLINGISQTAQILLLAFLEPYELGTFWIVSAAVSFFMYFSDIGLAAALVQKKEKLTRGEMVTTFTVQQGLVLILVLALLVLSPQLTQIYQLSTDAVVLLFALGGSLFLSSLKSIPSVLLERKLEFGKFVLPEILENLVYNVIVVFLAWKGMGIASFTYAVLARGLVGVVVIYLIRPWRPGLGISRVALRGLLRFGVPYQANTLISVLKDQGVTLLLGGVLGQAAIGYLGSAMRLSQIPLRLIMDNVTKVSFPAFSRMQEDRRELGRSVTLSIQFITSLVYPMLFGFLALVPTLMIVFPKYQKWESAILALFIVSVNTVFAAFATQLTNLFMAVGKVSLTIRFTILYTLLTLLLVPMLAVFWGFNGAAVGYALVGVASGLTVVVVKRIISFSTMEAVVKPLIAASAMYVSLNLLTQFVIVAHIFAVFGLVLLGGGIYALVLYGLVGRQIITYAQKIIRSAI